MVEEHHKAQDMGRIFSKGINHQGSSSRSNGEKIGMNIKVRRGLSPLRSKCCSSLGDNKRLLNLHEQKIVELEAFKSNTQIFQTNTSASLKNLETQVGQLALTL